MGLKLLLILEMILTVKSVVRKPAIELAPGDIINVSFLKKYSTRVYDNLLENSKVPVVNVELHEKPELIVYDIKNFYDVKLFYYNSFNIGDMLPRKKRRIFNRYGESLEFEKLAGDNKKVKKYYRYELVTLCYHAYKREIIYDMSKPLQLISFNNVSRVENFHGLVVADSLVAIRFDDEVQDRKYLSSITTGNCLYQVAAYQPFYNIRQNSECQITEHEMNSPRRFIYATSIKSKNNNLTLENLVEKYVNNTSNLIKTETIDLIKLFDNKEICMEILKEFNNDTITKMNFMPIPKAIEMKDKIINKRIGNETLQPGDTVNKKNSQNIEVIDSFADESLIKKNLLNLKTQVKVSSCLKFEELFYYEELFEIIMNSSKITSKNLRILRNSSEKNHGIDDKFINDDHLFVLLQVCKFTSISYINLISTVIIDLNGILKKRNKNFIANKDVVFYKLDKNETHFISSIFTGDCLYQVFVYPQQACKNVDKNLIIQENPVTVGRILSVSNNKTLENWVEDYLKHDNILRLMENKIVYNTTMDQLYNNATVGLELQLLVPD